MDLKEYEQQIRKTGFALEHHVSTVLKEKGWGVISNKYYIDDHEENVREIDLIAYKASQVQHFIVYSALIISCKKNEANVWALLSRPLNKKDPNRTWHPTHTWTNDKALQFQLSKQDFESDYHARVEEKALNALADPAFDIFAFQEMNQKKGTPQNDKAIFGSITSLMKAQAYEVRALPTRKTAPCIYHFSLLSVVDAEMIRLLFEGDTISASEIDSEQYLANYIIDKKQDISRIRFIKKSAFNQAISDYDKLHEFNCKVFSDYNDEFYDGVLENFDRTQLFIKEFRNAVWFTLHWILYRKFEMYLKKDSIVLSWRPDQCDVAVNIPAEGYQLTFLNNDSESKMTIAKALVDIYRYKGPFIFSEDDDVPF